MNLIPRKELRRAVGLLDSFWDRNDWFSLPDLAEKFGQFACDFSEDENTVYVSAELPGVKKDQVHIEYQNGYLSISAEKRKETEKKEKNYSSREISYGMFRRTFNVGAVDFDHANAELKEGTLKVTLPKSAQSKSRRLSIR